MVHSKIEKLLKLPQHEQRSPEWFAQRYTKLTSSDAATVLGIGPMENHTNFYLKNADMIQNRL